MRDLLYKCEKTGGAMAPPAPPVSTALHITIYCLSKGANFYREMPTYLVAESKSKSNFVDMDKNNNSDACVLVNVKIESKCKSRL